MNREAGSKEAVGRTHRSQLEKALSVAKKSLLSACFFLLITLAPSSTFGFDVGSSAEDFTLEGADGSVTAFKTVSEGASVLVLEFLSVYCHTCQEHADLLNHITQEYQEEGVRVLAVALGNDQEEVDEFVETYGVKYPILADPDMVTARLYGIREVPTVYLIDGFGTVRYRGFPDRHEELEDELDYVFDGHEGELEVADVAADAALTDL